MKQFFDSGVEYSYIILSNKVVLYYMMCVVVLK